MSLVIITDVEDLRARSVGQYLVSVTLHPMALLETTAVLGKEQPTAMWGARANVFLKHIETFH